ncbi:DNA protection during starvation protein 2 [Clavibacter michiganensis subsp. michiganensis]|nr:DNA protection during starvation protein 2 [Clavibacter michiganensis subsp. michiganensis]OUD97313.1 DNA protection during starvation protein 2 [Clavibacter michiganensis subsp. michiganensis]OUE07135.1 DNA protection during starvation protein 2 [Clavibacter michiganensis subsp. michiganensis]OUE20163.1 DNA protection during starvation protein 2 [Clavibacter michiganensis subsp. michiganensis]
MTRESAPGPRGRIPPDASPHGSGTPDPTNEQNEESHMTTTVERPTSASEKATQPEGSKKTKRQNVERGFTASEQLHESMQKVLVDLIELHIQGKQAHWNVVGKNFRDLHLQLDEIIDSAREFSDDLAERMRALHATPDGRSDTVAETTTLPEYPQGEVDTAETVDLVTQRLEAAVHTMREVHDDVDEEDPTTADLLHGFITALEQYAWMVSAENRRVGSAAE